MPFTIDEKTIIKMYAGAELNRNSVFNAINENVQYIENAEIKALTESVLRKIRAMSVEDFSEIDLSDVLEFDTGEI